MVVDDDDYIRRAFLRTFRDRFDVSVASCGKEALEMLPLGFDVILSDFDMPGMDGKDFLDELMERDPEMARRTVFMTGGLTSPRGIRFFADRKFLPKPLDVRDVESAILYAGRSNTGGLASGP